MEDKILEPMNALDLILLQDAKLAVICSHLITIDMSIKIHIAMLEQEKSPVDRELLDRIRTILKNDIDKISDYGTAANKMADKLKSEGLSPKKETQELIDHVEKHIEGFCGMMEKMFLNTREEQIKP